MSGEHLSSEHMSVNHRGLPRVVKLVGGGAGDYVRVVGWDDRGQSAFVRPCVNYNPGTGHFQINQEGLYSIISHLAFMGPRRRLYDQSRPLYGQRVMRKGWSEPVLVDLQYGPAVTDQPAGSAPDHNSVVAGVAHLKAGELIYVEAKPVDRLTRGNLYSSLSLIKLQNG